MKEYRRHVKVFTFLYRLFFPIAVRLFNYSYDDLSDVNGPYLLLSNHNTDYDPIFVLGAMKKHGYFVATENLTRMGIFGKIIIFLFKPIIHYKGKTGIITVKNILHELKAGHNVCMFPEGNRSFNGLTSEIAPTTGKLVKRSGASLVTFRMDGGYFTSPRWSVTRRKGKLTGRRIHVYTPEMLSSMTDEEINSAIAKDLYVDAYEEQKKSPVAFKGKKLAEGIESTLFMCPRCRKIGTLFGKNNHINCGCGFNAEYDEFGYIKDETGRSFTVTEIDREQKKLISDLADSPENQEFFSDMVTVNEIDDKTHQVLSKIESRFSAFPGKFLLGNKEILFGNISGLAIHSRNTLIMHIKEGERHIDIKGPVSFSALKYLYLYKASGTAQI